MRKPLRTTAALLLLLGATSPRPASAEETRVQWARPQRMPQETRVALTRLLAAAVDGRLPAGTRVKGSRPTPRPPHPGPSLGPRMRPVSR
jgi:hypothetical protein